MHDFPWGDLDPPGGYRVGDYVGLIYSDHEKYIFDEPTGVVIAVKERPDWDEGAQLVTIQIDPIEIMTTVERLYLIKRDSGEAANA